MSGTTGQAAAIRAMIRAAAEGGLPALDPVAERFAFHLAAALRGLGAGPVDTGKAAVRSAPLAGLLEGEALAGVVRARGWTGRIMLLLDAGLDDALVGRLLGGAAAPSGPAPRRTPTPIELRLLREVMAAALSALAQTLAPLAETAFEVERIEADPRLAAIAPGTATAIEIAIPVQVGGPGEAGGRLRVVLPVPSLTALRDAWARQRRGDADTDWAAGFREALHRVELPALAVFGEVTATPAEILGWRPGDMIPLLAGDADRARLVAGGRTLCHGTIGHSRGVRALRIEQAASPAAPEGERS
ncbi:flagellar motor switch protein FliM [Inquilinus sp. NPDC058860]|uniref:flagellar motor switch protein FliM n=1 Tax=Inquilinus sp. NPDC058860 TaxID=3346652 RepID=UPI0036BF7E29